VLTLDVETVNTAVVAPAGTVTLPGTPATLVLLLATDTVTAACGAALNVMTPCAVEPPATLVGLITRLCRVGPACAVTVNVAVRVPPL
jgi:hypothetical protein